MHTFFTSLSALVRAATQAILRAHIRGCVGEKRTRCVAAGAASLDYRDLRKPVKHVGSGWPTIRGRGRRRGLEMRAGGKNPVTAAPIV